MGRLRGHCGCGKVAFDNAMVAFDGVTNALRERHDESYSGLYGSYKGAAKVSDGALGIIRATYGCIPMF